MRNRNAANQMSKKEVLVIILAIMACLTIAGCSTLETLQKTNVGNEDIMVSFRDIQWGTSIFELKDMRPKPNKSGFSSTQFKRWNENLMFGNIGLNEVEYIFFQDRFSKARLYADGHNSFVQFKKMFEKKYGKPVIDKEETPSFEWQVSHLWIVLRYDKVRNQTEVMYSAGRFMELVKN